MLGTNRVRQRLNSGKPVFGLIVNFDSPNLIDLLALAGFDYVLLDAEHGPLVPASAEATIRAAEAGGMSTFVRVPDNRPSEILRYLDLGADGVQVAHVDNAEEARAGVAALRYPPLGERGLATHTRAANYNTAMSPADYIDLANRELAFFATIETRAAVENIDEIATVPGLDGLCIGPGDMSVSMGHKGNRRAPDVLAGVARVLQAAKAHNKWVSLPASDEASALECLRMGANIIQFPANYFILSYGRQFLRAMQSA